MLEREEEMSDERRDTLLGLLYQAYGGTYLTGLI